MSAIYDRPLDYDFGLDFDYSLWTMDSKVDFLNVPWDANYRDVVRFTSRGALNDYINENVGESITIREMSYIKPNQPIMVDVKHNVANRFNYIRVHNPLQPGDDDINKDFYYFITGVEYIAPDVTAIYVQLDVWQTYIYDVTFGNCYIERGHIGVANQNRFRNFGRDFLTVPEGLDAGSEMRVIATRKDKIMGTTPPPVISPNVSVLVVATQDLSSDPGVIGSANVITATGTQFENVFVGAGIYGFASYVHFSMWLEDNKTKPWRTQSVQAIYLVPDFSRYSDTPFFDGVEPGTPVKLDGYSSLPVKHQFFPNWRNSAEINDSIPARYVHVRDKFKTFPYMVVEMTTWTAAPIVLKPESWADHDAFVLERASMLPPSQRIEFVPRRYNGVEGSEIDNWQGLPDNDPIIVNNPRYQEIGDDHAEYLDVAARILSFPSVPTVNNGAIAYLAANNASIQQSYASADWSQQRALAGNQLAFDQSDYGSSANSYRTGLGMDLLSGMTGVNNQRTLNAANTQAASGIANGIMSAFSGDNPIGAIMGTGINTVASYANAANNMQSNLDAANLQLYAMGENGVTDRAQEKFMRDTNKSYEDFAAKGDYAQTIATIDAKVRDAHMIQPTMSGQFGGEFANISNNTVEISIRFKLIDPAAIATIGEFWLQFGYAVHRSVSELPANLMVMTKFTYWKLQKTFIRSAPMPEPFRQTIRGIMESGVTVWRNPDYIGFTDFADNAPIAGIEL